MAVPSTTVWIWKDPWHLLARHSSPKEIPDVVKRPSLKDSVWGEVEEDIQWYSLVSTGTHTGTCTSTQVCTCGHVHRHTQDNCIQFGFSKSITTTTPATAATTTATTKAKTKPTVVTCTYSLRTQQVKSRGPGVQGYLHPWLHTQFEVTMGHMKSYLKKSEGEKLC